MKEKAGRGPDAAIEVFAVFLRLGLTSFGGPIAHLSYFRDAFVLRRKWLSELRYADLVALCQFLPGPASSQVGMAIGLTRAGLAGALAAWLGFTLPSALLMTGFGYALLLHRAWISEGLLHGLKLVAVAVIAQAVWGMARTLTPDRPRASIAVAAALVVLLLPFPWVQVAVIAAAGLAGRLLLKADAAPPPLEERSPVSRRIGFGALALFFILLLGLPLLAQLHPGPASMIWSFYRTGALVFGGGHVVLPLLQTSVVPPGWVSNDAFLAGYGAAQALPGPLFSFAAFLGTVMTSPPQGAAGAVLCLIAIFAPSFFLVTAALPFWDWLRAAPAMRRALAGINAAVVGLLIAALYTPVWTSAVLAPSDLAICLAAFAALVFWRAPVLLVGLTTAAAGWLLA
jgi:chromate transporter